MIIYDLVLEVTRKCNLQCRHCIRGPAQRLVMSNQVLNNVLMHLTHIGSVSFTGGEPSLATGVIEEFIQTCHWRHIGLGGFGIITNGKVHKDISRFIKACDKLYWLADDQGACSVSVSQDQYHKELRDVAWHRYEQKDEYSGESFGEFPSYFHKREFNIDQPIDEGRAHTNGLGWRKPDVLRPWVTRDNNGELEVTDDVGMVYVSANGNVVSECDISFERIDRENKGNVLVTPLPQIIEAFCQKEAA